MSRQVICEPMKKAGVKRLDSLMKDSLPEICLNCPLGV